MADMVVNGAPVQCSFGMAPAPLAVLPTSRLMSASQPVANITDAKPLANIASFGSCTSISNPTVAAATAAAFGALTPMPCLPVTAAWTPGSPTVHSGPAPALTNSCKCTCAYGGSISIVAAGQVGVSAA